MKRPPFWLPFAFLACCRVSYIHIMLEVKLLLPVRRPNICKHFIFLTMSIFAMVHYQLFRPDNRALCIRTCPYIFQILTQGVKSVLIHSVKAYASILLNPLFIPLQFEFIAFVIIRYPIVNMHWVSSLADTLSGSFTVCFHRLRCLFVFPFLCSSCNSSETSKAVIWILCNHFKLGWPFHLTLPSLSLEEIYTFK